MPSDGGHPYRPRRLRAARSPRQEEPGGRALGPRGVRELVRRHLIGAEGTLEYLGTIELFGCGSWRADWFLPPDEGVAVIVPARALAAVHGDLEAAVSEEVSRAIWRSLAFTLVLRTNDQVLLTSREPCVMATASSVVELRGADPSLSPGVAPPAHGPPPGWMDAAPARQSPNCLPLALIDPEFYPLAEAPAGRLMVRRLVEVNPGPGARIAEPRNVSASTLSRLALELAWEGDTEEGYRLLLRRSVLGDLPVALLELTLGLSRPGLSLWENHGVEALIAFQWRRECVWMTGV